MVAARENQTPKVVHMARALESEGIVVDDRRSTLHGDRLRGTCEAEPEGSRSKVCIHFMFIILCILFFIFMTFPQSSGESHTQMQDINLGCSHFFLLSYSGWGGREKETSLMTFLQFSYVEYQVFV